MAPIGQTILVLLSRPAAINCPTAESATEALPLLKSLSYFVRRVLIRFGMWTARVFVFRLETIANELEIRDLWKDSWR
jgi:hypothetical protein